MTTIRNEILINAPIERVWKVLSDIEALDQYDPTVKKSTALSTNKQGIGAKRRVDMRDGKNWFEEKVTEFKPNELLTYELTACSFPVQELRHTYSFESSGDQIKVKQLMRYEVKFGFVGKLLDTVMIRRRSDAGIKKFFKGLKSFTEKSS